MKTATAFRPGDIDGLARFHGRLYLKEWRYDRRFEEYVAEGLAAFARRFDRKLDRLWLVKSAGQIIGSVAIAHRTRTAAQLRWFLVDPAHRRKGLGTRLLRTALRFARSAGYRSVFLWTTGELDAARRVYERSGFRRKARRKHDLWGRQNVAEERYSLKWRPATPAA